MSDYSYTKGVTLGPAIAVRWINGLTGDPYDFSSGWTFTADIVDQNATTVRLRQKTTGITGSSGASNSYNVLIDWETADHADLTAGGAIYQVMLRASPTSGDPLDFPGTIKFRLNSAAAPAS